MGAVPKSVPSAVPSAVPSSSNTVAVDTASQYVAYKPMSGATEVPYVPRTKEPGDDEMQWQPVFAGDATMGMPDEDGSNGAPSVPDELVAGMFYKPGPIDQHYQVPSDKDFYKLVGDPPTRGVKKWIKSFQNYVFNGTQNVDEAGWQQNSPQQRTSYMRMVMPPQGMGYDPEGTGNPVQLPQAPATQKFLPTTGNDAPGVYPGGTVLNSQTYGAGQVAGGEGGQLYSPEPGPPPTTSTADQAQAPAGQPMWG